ncbi:uncharacterized protein LOC131636668 [Vicia villosa]|uniref:uncharacterized protein LOC131636668 n=1 Tax=Vicia villosa TaxID=3911 RepID=UPI00273ADB8D|nr:uncharacterized protein LOC131636668 [Vicia villosa]
MGNSALGGSLCNGMNFPCQLKLGRHVAIKVIKKKESKLEEEDEEDEYEDEDEEEDDDEDEDDEEDEDEDEDEDVDVDDEKKIDDGDKNKIPNNLTKVTYTVSDWSKCELEYRESNNCNIASFTLRDNNKNLDIHNHFTIRKVEPNYLETSDFEPKFDYSRGDFEVTRLKSTFDWSRSGNEWRGFTESSFLFYHTEGTNRGLVVVERKKKSKDEKPFMVTVAHYYFIHDFYVNLFKIDIGLSVIVKVESIKNEGLYSTLEGPTQHPASALIYMMDEVRRTGIWKPATCPHCATLEEQQSSRAKGSFSRRAINNDGTFNGNGSGNMIQGDFNQFTIYRK